MISVETFKVKSVTEQSVEIVERKGLGHPDYICDAVMDAISVVLCKEYMREFGTILHIIKDIFFLPLQLIEETIEIVHSCGKG